MAFSYVRDGKYSDSKAETPGCGSNPGIKSSGVLSEMSGEVSKNVTLTKRIYS